jgi:hypothetical protein
MAKTWNVRWATTPNATLDDPLELVIVRAEGAPAKVRIEIWESDAQKHELDDYDNRKLGEDDDDHIATFEGALVAEPARPDGRLFVSESVKRHYDGPQGADEVKIRFEGSKEVHTLAIPHFRGEPIDIGEDPKHVVGDGEFYEIYAKILDAGTGSLLTTVAVHNLRRKCDVLLEVEPLNQEDAELTHALGRQILDYFHGGDTATASRKWGDVRCRKTLQMGDAGCSYACFTMVLRYLRVLVSDDADPADPKSWTTLYDKYIKDLKDEHRPAMFRTGPSTDDLADFLEKMRSKKTMKKRGWTAVSDVKWDEKVVARSDAPASSFRFAPDVAHWWPMRVAWFLRQQDGAAIGDTFKELPGYVECTKEDGTIERVDLDEHNWVFPESETATEDRTVNGDLKPVDPTGALLRTFGLQNKSMSIDEEKGANWVEFVKKQLDAGIPVIANVKSGCYRRPEMKASGHFVLIVGYRREKDRIRFVINDPAGAKKLQYACLFEDEMEPSLAKSVDRVQKIDARAILYKKVGKKKKGKGDEIARADLPFSADKLGTVGKAMLSVEGQNREIAITVSPEIWDAKEQLDRVRVVSTFAEADPTPVVKDQWVTVGGAKKDKSLPEGHFRRIGQKPAVRTWADPADPTITWTLEITLVCELDAPAGPRGARDREGRYNLLLDRRRFDSLAILYVYQPKTWSRGAARFIPMTATAAAGG